MLCGARIRHIFLLGLLLQNWSFFIRPSISLPGTKPKSASDDRDFALAGLLQEKSWGRLGPQWIRPTPPRLHILDGEVTECLSQPRVASVYPFCF